MPPRDAAGPAGPLRVAVVESLAEVPRERWNALVGPDDFYQSHEWLTAVERDRTARCHYLLARIGDRLAGALPVYQVAFEGSPPYRPARLRALLGVPGDHLVAGARRCYRGTVLLAPWLPDPAADRVTAALLRAALDLAAARGRAGVVLPFLPTSAVARIGRVLPVTVAFDTPEAVLPGIGGGLPDYLRALPGKRRYTARREIARYDAAGWHTRTERLADCLPEAARLVSLVERRHGRNTPDILLLRLFRRQAEATDHRAVVLSCRDDRGAMVACSINYAWRGTLYNRAVGLDPDRLRDAFEYFNLLVYRAVDHAGDHGLNRLHLSVEPSHAKLQRGAVLAPLWTAVVGGPTAGRRPGVRVVGPDPMESWAEPRRSFPHAFPAARWAPPGPGRPSVAG
ncbi:GNAT family N-acetyltransferase [Streptomyces sp. B6B3]|uniref:GNAT family N-acetyltransferase n=1 Tax=Streptomyces sp. B6B3 TaxID=3153570 RepID=UPI00325F28EB